MSKRVLIIDDHKSWLSVLNSILLQSGFEVRIASTGIGGLKSAESETPDIILLDLMMPEVNGFDMCQKLRANTSLDNTPILIVSALSSPEDQQKAFDLGANDFMIKPVHPIDLIRRMNELLEKRESTPTA